jgi:hypothetical protein
MTRPNHVPGELAVDYDVFGGGPVDDALAQAETWREKGPIVLYAIDAARELCGDGADDGQAVRVAFAPGGIRWDPSASANNAGSSP